MAGAKRTKASDVLMLTNRERMDIARTAERKTFILFLERELNSLNSARIPPEDFLELQCSAVRKQQVCPDPIAARIIPARNSAHRDQMHKNNE